MPPDGERRGIDHAALLDRALAARVARRTRQAIPSEFDPAGQREASRLMAVGEGWVMWLQTIRWDWWTSPSFRNEPSQAAAVRAVQQWLSPFPNAYAALGLQRGPIGHRLHLHVLIGGTGRRPLVKTLLRGSWRRGDLTLQGYRPSQGGVTYLVRQADEIELLGAPQTYRPRKRGGRKQRGA